MKNIKEMIQLAEGLKNSNEKSMVTLATAFLELHTMYNTLYNRLVKETSQKVMKQHHETLRKLVD